MTEHAKELSRLVSKQHQTGIGDATTPTRRRVQGLSTPTAQGWSIQDYGQDPPCGAIAGRPPKRARELASRTRTSGQTLYSSNGIGQDSIYRLVQPSQPHLRLNSSTSWATT
jgi:hypothetical protein